MIPAPTCRVCHGPIDEEQGPLADICSECEQEELEEKDKEEEESNR